MSVEAQSLNYSKEGSRDPNTADWTTQYIHNFGTSLILSTTVIFLEVSQATLFYKEITFWKTKTLASLFKEIPHNAQ